MSEKTYNGWTNYETWNVKLWMDNEEGSYRWGRELAQESWDNAEADRDFTREQRAMLDLADTLKSHYQEAMGDFLDNANASSSFWADLLGAALSEVNWHEIAANMLSDVDKNIECAYCSEMVSELDSVPPVDDDEAWDVIAKEHDSDCEWVLTRAHRRELPHEEDED